MQIYNNLSAYLCLSELKRRVCIYIIHIFIIFLIYYRKSELFILDSSLSLRMDKRKWYNVCSGQHRFFAKLHRQIAFDFISKLAHVVKIKNSLCYFSCFTALYTASTALSIPKLELFIYISYLDGSPQVLPV